jgi:hypothetical protein
LWAWQRPGRLFLSGREEYTAAGDVPLISRRSLDDSRRFIAHAGLSLADQILNSARL